MRAIALLLCTAATSPPASYGFTPSLLGGFVGSSYRSPSITAAAAAASTEAEATPAADSSTDCASDKPQLYDLPVSNNGARVRMCIYYKELEEDVDIVSPMDLGGLQSPEYKAVNPQGKMPAMAVGDLNFGESDTIVRYLLDRFVDKGPSLLGASLEERLLANAVARHHDMYIGPIQGCMYKAFPPFGVFGGRREALNELLKQLQVLEDMVAPKATDTGPFLAGGTEPTLADCTVFPTALFIEYMLPKFGFSADEFFGPTVGAWFYGAMGEGNPVAQRVRGEIVGALEKWDARGRWDTIAGAGKRDTADATLFDKILKGEIPADVVHEDDKCLAFRDINPVAPTHVLVIPKHREGLTQLRMADAEHKDILGHLLVVAAKVANAEGFTAENNSDEGGDGSGYRIVINDGIAAAQSVFHLHVHVIGGRDMTWPPG